MTSLTIDFGELRRISTRSGEVKEGVQGTLSGVNTTLSDICQIVDSPELTANNNALTGSINSMSNETVNALERIKEFLDAQLTNYAQNISDALEKLSSLITTIDGLFGGESSLAKVGPDTSVYATQAYSGTGFNITTDNTTYSLSDEEYRQLCATVFAEAAPNIDDALGVTSVILNRVDAGNFGGSTVQAVISASGQFSGYRNSNFWNAYYNGAPEYVTTAVNDALNGVRNNEYYFFRSNGSTRYSDNRITQNGNRYGNG